MIRFHTLRWKNFLSTGSIFNELVLDKPKPTLIVGENGAGKTTFIDALCFGLYNRPYRDINRALLVNNKTERNLLVEIEFSIGTIRYMVRRGIKPNVFEIYADGKMVDQTADARDFQAMLEDDILKIDYKTFTQIVILGTTDYVPFMKLSAASRRQVVEDLLDLQMFSAMNVIVKEDLADIKAQITEAAAKMDTVVAQQKLAAQMTAKIAESKDSARQTIETRIAGFREKIEAIDAAIASLNQQQQSLGPELQQADEAAKQRDQNISRRLKLFGTNEQLKQDIRFYESNDHCPTCKQTIEMTFRSQEVERLQHQYDSTQKDIADLRQAIDQDKSAERYASLRQYFDSNAREIDKQNTQKKLLQSFIEQSLQELDDIDKPGSDLREGVTEQLAERHALLSKHLARLNKRKDIIDAASVLLKDSGIKAQVIDRYIPIVNQLINSHLDKMDMFIDFAFDSNFEDSVNSREASGLGYNSFSQGEKARINLAVMFAWRDVAKLRNSSNCALLILDETFDGSLDTEGDEALTKMLQTISSDEAVIVISHKDSIIDKFSNTVRFEKKNNFSQMVAQQ